MQAAAAPSLRAGDLGQYDCPDGQVFVWRSPDGPYQVSACLLTVPGRRPDLQQITFVPRSIEPAHMDTDAAEGPSLWHGPVLADMLTCGLCGHLLTSERPTAYSCPTGCLPELDSEELELPIARSDTARISARCNPETRSRAGDPHRSGCRNGAQRPHLRSTRAVPMAQLDDDRSASRAPRLGVHVSNRQPRHGPRG